MLYIVNKWNTNAPNNTFHHRRSPPSSVRQIGWGFLILIQSGIEFRLSPPTAIARNLYQLRLFMPTCVVWPEEMKGWEVGYVGAIVVSALILKWSRKLLMGIGYSDTRPRGGGKSSTSAPLSWVLGVARSFGCVFVDLGGLCLKERVAKITEFLSCPNHCSLRQRLHLGAI